MIKKDQTGANGEAQLRWCRPESNCSTREQGSYMTDVMVIPRLQNGAPHGGNSSILFGGL
jgi:hypothetical protein